MQFSLQHIRALQLERLELNAEIIIGIIDTCWIKISAMKNTEVGHNVRSLAYATFMPCHSEHNRSFWLVITGNWHFI